MSVHNSLTVLIPTSNRAQSLERLLKSLDRLLLPEIERFEVLVVNNGSTDETASLLRREATKRRKFDLRIVEEPKKGKARALNSGLRQSRGQFLALLDDDVTVAPDWLLRLMEAYWGTDFDAIQGKVLPGLDPQGEPADPEKLREYNIPIIDYGDRTCEIRGLTGTNMSFKRAVFEKVGFFDVRLGPGASGFSEDTEYSMRIRQAGFRIGYTPYAVAYHELNPARYGRDYNRVVQYRKGFSRSLYRQQSILFNVLPNLFANCVRYLIYRCMRKREKSYKTEGRIMKYWGYLKGRLQRRMGKEPWV